MSAFDDEFGLFGDDEAAPEEERKSTLGARQIASSDSFSDDIEPEDERPARRRSSAAGGEQRGDRRPYRDHGPRPAGDPAVAQARAVELLTFLAKRLVSKPDDVIVALVEGNRGPVIELEVHPDDFGKVIGKGGRVAQALRTIVRASAEGKITIDIVDVEDDDEHEADLEHAGDPSEAVDAVAEAPAEDESEDAIATTKKKPAAKKTAAKKTAAKKAPAAKKRAPSAAAAKRKKKS